MEKFVFEKHKNYLNDFVFSYFSSAPYLDFMGYTFNRNGEDLIVWQDMIFPHDFPSIFLPRNKLNWANATIAFATPEEIEKIKSEGIEIRISNKITQEYFYKTESLLNLTGKLGQRVRQFERNYKYKIFNSYSVDKIKDFYEFWKNQKSHNAFTFDEAESFFLFLLDKLDKYKIRQVYVEIDGKLVGMAWGLMHQSGNWIGLHLKVDYEYRGLSRFLHNERAKLFADCDLFTLGTGAFDPGITQFKTELGPSLVRDYNYILTGGKLE